MKNQSLPVPFLKLVADYLQEHYADDFSRIVVVFPNKRASIFFEEYLQTDKTCWAPRYFSITELFQSFTCLQVNNDIDTVCRLYILYRRFSGSHESLDSFFGWGEKLLADFDDIDKSMVDAERLLQNVTDYKSIDFGDYLSEDQRILIRRFFGENHPSGESGMKENFLKMWRYLWPMYRQLREELKAEGLSYEGMLFRTVMEQLIAGETRLPEEIDKYVFVGFNALDRVEEELFDFLQKQDRALFFWDYDVFYANENSAYEAGYFVQKNMKRFPSPLSEACFHNMEKEKSIDFVAASTENAQAYSVYPWLEQHLTQDPKKTAIILCNEELLEPVIHAFPENVEEVNITKGFPLTHTPVYGEICQFLDETIQKSSRLPSLISLSLLSDFIKERASRVQCAASLIEKDGKPLDFRSMLEQLYAEAYFLAYSVVGKLKNVAETGRLEVGFVTLERLVKRVLSQQSVPFHGHPVSGLQVMGLLETRCLDFENIILLSVNEGKLPAVFSDNSFVPYPLKVAYGMTLASKRTAVYAYYFYRLLQRAKKIRLMYNDFTNPLQPSEMSRFMLQLIVSRKFNINYFKLSSRASLSVSERVEIPKPRNLYDLLNPLCTESVNGKRGALSPSSLNMYLDCPLKFYLYRVAGLRCLDPEKDDIQSNTFGNVFHDAAEIYYSDCVRRKVSNFKYENGRVLSEKGHTTLRACIQQAYERQEVNPDVIVTETVLKYLQNLLQRDAELQSLQIIGLEMNSDVTVKVEVEGELRDFVVGGRIDRLDVVTRNGCDEEPLRTMRIVDYKTGLREHKAADVDEIFHAETARPYYLFQILLYSMAEENRTMERCGEKLPVSAALFYPALATRFDYDPWVKLGEKKQPLHVVPREVMKDFREKLKQTLEELLDRNQPFRPTPGKSVCEHCDFFLLCGAAVHRDG